MLLSQKSPKVVLKRVQIAGRFPQSYYRGFFLTCMRGTRGNLISLHFNPFSLIIHIYMDVLGTEIHFTVIVKRPL